MHRRPHIGEGKLQGPVTRMCEANSEIWTGRTPEAGINKDNRDLPLQDTLPNTSSQGPPAEKARSQHKEVHVSGMVTACAVGRNRSDAGHKTSCYMKMSWHLETAPC